MLRRLFPFATLLLSGPVFADCALGPDYFSCSFPNGKRVQVCPGPSTATYSYGAPGLEPELELPRAIEDVAYYPWPGVGRSIYEEVAFDNGAVRYAVWSSLDRTVLDDTDPTRLTGGVTVTRSDETLATLDCQPGTITARIDALYDAKIAANQCWNRETFTWERCIN